MLADPFAGMEFGDAVREKKVRREAPSYLTSCGLAMRRFLQ
jgi:type IV pilus assembly protein PilM